MASVSDRSWRNDPRKAHRTAPTPPRARSEFARNNENRFCWTLSDAPESIDVMSSTPPVARSSLEPRTASAAEAAGATPPSGASGSRARSLLWFVFLVNGSVLVVALLLLTFTPIEIDAPKRDMSSAAVTLGDEERVVK
jgi:hypothetical protein